MKSALITLLSMAIGMSAHAAKLPQSQPYQKVIRDYMATLTEKDFDVPLKPVKYITRYFSDPDKLAQYWMLFLEKNPDIPSHEGIRIQAKHFTLAAIEAGNAINMSVGRGKFMDPKDTAWWTQWDYPGNPYFKSKPAKLRAFVAASVDMMMEDHGTSNGQNNRSDYLGGCMIRFGYTYLVVKDVLPLDVQKAYATGLGRIFGKLEGMTPRGSGGSDMEMFQLVGMWYAADALGGDYKARALKRAKVVFDRVTSKTTGYEKHGGAFDVSYQGIALRFLTWAAVLYDDSAVYEALHKMIVLKAYLTLPEPNGKEYGPTHFSTGTAADAPHDQWAWVSRDLAMAMIDDDALYTVWSRLGIPKKAVMKAKVKTGIQKLGGTAAINKAPANWEHVHWVNTLNYAHDLYRPKFFARLDKLNKQKSMLTKPPFGRNKDFIVDLNGGGEFLAAKLGGYGVIIHTGPVALKWASGVSGKSGGTLSAFWTPGRGSAIMGRCRATQSKEPDEWTDTNGRGPYTWAVHAITGKGAKGNYFSTARFLTVKSKYKISGNRAAAVVAAGDLGASSTADPKDELPSGIKYRREFQINKKGVSIKSSLSSNADGKMKELWEMIPLYFGSKYHDTEPAGKVLIRASGRWRAPTREPMKADQVKLTRYGKHVYIVFSKSRSMKLSPEIKDRSIGNANTRNLMINLLEGDGPPSVSYRISPRP